MSDNLTSVLLALFVVVMPVWIIFHYLGRFRAGRELNAQDSAAFEHLSQTAARMEARMAVLERILDAEVPNWRSNPNLSGQYHGTMG